MTEHKHKLLGLVSLLKVDLLADSSQSIKLLEFSEVTLFGGKKVTGSASEREMLKGSGSPCIGSQIKKP